MNYRKVVAVILLAAVLSTTSAQGVYAAGSANRATCAAVWRTFPTQKKTSSSTKYTKALQRILYHAYASTHNAIGSLSGVDGSFGNNTKNAVIAFQNKEGLSADGVVGANTWSGLYYNLADPSLSAGYYRYKPSNTSYGSSFIIRQHKDSGDWYVLNKSGSWERFRVA